MTTFESRWGSFGPGRGFQRVDEDHPLDFYIGVDISDHRVLLLVMESELHVPMQSQAIQVICSRRQDGRWALMFSLLRPDLGVIFSHLCEDIVESSRKISDKSKAGELILSRFVRWQRLLRSGSTGLLDESVQKGLLGELLFLRQLALPVYGTISALEGWVGPLNAEQDFRYVDRIFEIKTIGPDALTVRISSAEQLDDTDRPIQLVLVVLNQTDRTDADAFCLSSIVAELRQELLFDPAASALFGDRLLSIGYFDRDEYSTLFFRFDRFRYFAIREGFPRIVRSRLPLAVSSVRYELYIQACLPYEIVGTREE
ncbi:MAG: PD-(D/E)XK motif protein [Proteobacteria bacterium]|nr:PD-(D/E)XK motif protein [Pseudomonadota bacterium]